jgi:hypothetical protein
MDRKKLLGVVLFFFMGVSLFVPAAGAEMLKEVAIGVFDNAPSMAETDRFYMRYHGPEITRLSGPWMARYQLWLPYEPPEEAVERFGAVRGRYAELWYREDDYLDRPGLSGITQPPFNENSTRQSGQTNIMVPANPTDVFYDSDPHPEKTTILRWITIIRYPEGVSVEDGEKWFLEVHAKEAVKQPGLLKFVSHLAWENPGGGGVPGMPPGGGDMGMPPGGGDMGMPPGGRDMGMPPGRGDMEAPSGERGGMPPMMSARRSWVRVCEYWYKDFDAWRKAVLESPPKYTSPSWGGEYPFVEMASTFIPYYHDVDFLKGTYQINFDLPQVNYNTSP